MDLTSMMKTISLLWLSDCCTIVDWALWRLYLSCHKISSQFNKALETWRPLFLRVRNATNTLFSSTMKAGIV